ncbi:MAG TPA: hypothetical protein VND65_09575 [Candidatus Binatia bacterium]|nr:hypothetical protein [Candidatus Binatia bacterium]
MGLSVVVLQNDPGVARSLAGGLASHFHSVQLARSRDELRERVARSRPEVVILDMEQSRLKDIENLHSDFPSLPIVCTHRIPDEDMWIAALQAGAADVCSTEDVDCVLHAALRSVEAPQRVAA